MMNKKRDARFNMVMLPEERAMLQALADREGLTESDIVRRHIRSAYAEAFGDKRPGRPTPKYNAQATIEKRKQPKK